MFSEKMPLRGSGNMQTTFHVRLLRLLDALKSIERLILTQAFRIDADDTSTGALPALSRPPSRTDRDREIIDMSVEHAQITGGISKTTPADDDDAELQAAIKMSLGQELPDQENGITGTGQQFGPATKPFYDPAQWAVAPIASSREMVDHPPPAKRRRVEGEPVLLRGSKDSGYLAALLTIFHSIPLARQALLLPSLSILSYGYDPNWWSGSSDENRKSLTLNANDNSERNRLNLLAEVQCLMAFLDGTKRAYGSVDALSDLYQYRSYPAEGPFSRFLEAWKAAAMAEFSDEPLTQIFTSTAMKSMGPEDTPISKDLICLEPPVNRIEGQLLVDLLDTTVWNDNLENLDDVWISHCAEVFTIRMYDPGKKEEGLLLTTSPIWFPDRYMWECRERSQEMRKQMQGIRKEISHYTSLQRRFQFLWSPDKKTMSVKEVLEAAAKSTPAAMADRHSIDREDYKLTAANTESVKSEVDVILDKIEQKLDALEDRKEELASGMQKLAQQLTTASDDTSEPPFNKYFLQGVSTKPELVYVRHRNSDLLGLDDDDASSRSEWQWWKLSWSNGSSSDPAHPPVIGPVTQVEAQAATNNTNGAQVSGLSSHSVSKISEEEVIEAAKVESNSVVMVYANQNAINFEGTPVSQALQQFIKQDNLMFERECRGEEPSVEVDSDDTFENVPLSDSQGASHLDREMTPMSINSPPRDEDGQPSPKRPKSSDADWRPLDEQPPSYEDSVVQEMQEKPKNKIGLYAEVLMEKYGNGAAPASQQDDGVVHIEHSHELPR